MITATMQSSHLGMRKAFQSSSAAGPSRTAMPAVRRSVTTYASAEPKETLRRIASAIAAAQIALLPFAGTSFAALDTATEKKGLGATIEASDITREDQSSVLDKLQNKILPEAKTMLGKLGKEGSNYPSSIAKELETVETEVEGLIRQADDGGDMSNVKSAASGIEQQINALKAIVGFD